MLWKLSMRGLENPLQVSTKPAGGGSYCKNWRVQYHASPQGISTESHHLCASHSCRRAADALQTTQLLLSMVCRVQKCHLGICILRQGVDEAIHQALRNRQHIKFSCFEAPVFAYSIWVVVKILILSGGILNIRCRTRIGIQKGTLI